MNRNSNPIALCSAIALATGEGVPEWIHLLPAGEIRTVDGRGPYRVADMAALASASLQSGAKLPIDEVHATDKAAPLGLPARARGWIVELQAREDGLWGRIEWNKSGRELMEDRAYAGISPAILHSADGTIHKVVRASLTNTPNLQGLVALHSSEEEGMNWKAKLIAALGLDSNADDAAIDAALSAKTSEPGLHSQTLLGHPTVLALQAENSELTTRLNALTESVSRDKATAFVDAAIAAGHVGVKPLREDYIALHMTDPARAEKMVAALPKIGGTTITGDLAPEAGNQQLTAEDHQVMALFGVSEDDYKAGLVAHGLSKGTL